MKQHEMMGQRVMVRKQYKRVYKGKYRAWEPVDILAARGWVVGFRTIYDGRMDNDFDGWDNNKDYFVHGQPINCVLVSFAPRQNPVKVPLDGFELVAA